MENKNIIVLQHHPMNVFFTNTFYVKQFEEGETPDDYVIIDVTSRNKDSGFIRQLSPFFIGPVKASDGKEAVCFENMWQFGKVYKGTAIFKKKLSIKKSDEGTEVICTDEHGNPTADWFAVRDFGYSQTLAYRHPFTGTPAYHYYINERGELEKLGYIESRKKVYFPEYAKLVYNTVAFRRLQEIVASGKKLALVDFDGYNYYNKRYMQNRYEGDTKKNKVAEGIRKEDYINISCMKDVVNCSFLLAGHAFVLKALLQGDIEVQGEQIIDHAGILTV